MIITSLNKLTDLENIIEYSDAILAGNDSFSTINEISFTTDELIYIKNKVKENNKLFALKVDMMMHEYKINAFKEFINLFLDCDLYYCSDLGVVEILRELNLNDKVIYDPKTLICNSLDAKIYSDGINAIGLSLEIPLVDVNQISDSVNNNTLYKIFGYHQMCFSRRKLISLYLDEFKIVKNGDLFYLKEEKRNEFYRVLEREYGTIIFRDYVINMISHIKNIKAKYLFVESIFISNIVDVLKLINDVLNDKDIDLDEMYKKLNINSNEGFIYKDSIYDKVAMKNV